MNKIKKVYLKAEVKRIIKKLEKKFPGAIIETGNFFGVEDYNLALMRQIDFEVFLKKSMITKEIKEKYKKYIYIENLENEKIDTIRIYRTAITFFYSLIGVYVVCHAVSFEDKICYVRDDKKLILRKNIRMAQEKEGYQLIGYNGEKILHQVYRNNKKED